MTRSTTTRTELLIFLTPALIRDDADEELIKQVETERIHFLVDEAEAVHGPILSTRPPALEACPPEGPPVAPLIPAPGSPLSRPLPPMPTLPSQQFIPLTPGPAMPRPTGPAHRAQSCRGPRHRAVYARADIAGSDGTRSRHAGSGDPGAAAGRTGRASNGTGRTARRDAAVRIANVLEPQRPNG